MPTHETRDAMFKRLICWGCLLAGAGVVLTLVQLAAEVCIRRISPTPVGYVGLVVLAIAVGFMLAVFAIYCVAEYFVADQPRSYGSPPVGD